MGGLFVWIMGYGVWAGDPLQPWGVGVPGLPLPNFTYAPHLPHTVFTAMLQGFTEYIMYTVSIQWGSKAVTHTAWTKSSALEWLYKYPRADVFGRVTDIFGRSIAVRYYR